MAEKTGDARSGSQTLAEGLSRLDRGASKILDSLRLLNRKAVQAEQEIDKIPIEELEKAQRIIHQVNDEIQTDRRLPLPETPPDIRNLFLEERRSAERAGDGVRRTQEALNRLIEKHPELAEDPAVLSMKESLRQAEAGNASGLRRLEEIDRAVPEWEKHWKKFLNERQKVADQAEPLDGASGSGGGESQGAEGSVRAVHPGRLPADRRAGAAGERHPSIGGRGGNLVGGIGKIQSGQRDLAQGLRDGAEKAKEQVEDSGKKGEVISDPVQFKEKVHHEVPNYATGFAPYFISLSLWVGAMLLFTAVDLYRVFPDRGEPLSVPAAALIGLCQAVLLITAVVWGLGIQPELPAWLFLFGILMSVTFVALNYMLIALLGNAGRFLSIVDFDAPAGLQCRNLSRRAFARLFPLDPRILAHDLFRPGAARDPVQRKFGYGGSLRPRVARISDRGGYCSPNFIFRSQNPG